MNLNKQTLEQLDYIFSEIEKRYPSDSESGIMTDISFQAKQDSGELLAMNDDDEELASAVIENWIDYPASNFNEIVRETLKQYIINHKNDLEKMSVLHPYSFVLVDEEMETVSEIYQIDDDTIVIEHQDLMTGLDKDLNDFIDNLLKS